MLDSATTRTSSEIIEIHCPVPPSLNRLWRIRGKRLYRDPKHNHWVRYFWYCWLKVKPKNFKTIEGIFDAEILICPTYKRDADNNSKLLLDCCQTLGIVRNDGNARKVIQELVEKERAPLGCRLRIIPLA